MENGNSELNAIGFEMTSFNEEGPFTLYKELDRANFQTPIRKEISISGMGFLITTSVVDEDKRQNMHSAFVPLEWHLAIHRELKRLKVITDE